MRTILLDIDGVLGPTSIDKTKHFNKIEIGWNSLIYYEDVIDNIRSVSNDRQIIWCTTWERDALELSKILNLNINQFLKLSNSKLKSIKTICEKYPNKQFLLIDDELKNEDFNNNNILVFEINPTIGLTNETILNLKNI